MTDKQIIKKLDELIPEKVDQGRDWNIYSANPVIGTLDEVGANRFNEIYRMMKESDWPETIRTKSGGIAKGLRHRANCCSWYTTASSREVQIVIIAYGYLYVYKIGASFKKKGIYPSKAFSMFYEKCLENGIDLNKYKVDNGPEIKDTIDKPLIHMNVTHTVEDKGLENCHHVDFHNSYPAGLANTHPEFRPVVEYFYKGRKINPTYKDVLNFTIGYMQSTKGGKTAAWAQLSKDAIEDNIDRVLDLAAKLRKAKRKVIGFNTDGIWYQGEIYHGKGEGDNLGEWHNDHVNCLLRVKSKGAYEFIENGKYFPVLRGFTKLDRLKPRELWKWGDIYNTDANAIKLYWSDAFGVILKEDEGDDDDEI